MSLETSETELPKRKKAAIKPKAEGALGQYEQQTNRAKRKPVGDRHVVQGERAWIVVDDVIRFINETTDENLSELQAAIALEVTGRHARIREQLEAQAAAVGAKVTFPGKGSRKGEAAPVKYRDEHGNTWAGRGMKPVWLRERIDAGMSLEDFEV